MVTPGVKDSLRLVDDAPEPPESEGPVLVEALAVGICGTDREIIAAEYGEAPPGSDGLVLGHESLGRVLEDPTGTLRPGDLVAGIVRRPDPVPCPNCAVGEWDMCRNGRYTEHGIKAAPGFARERWRMAPDCLVRLDPGLGGCGVLLEPTSVVAKAWEHIDRIGGRARWEPRTALVTGTGPIGLLAALLATQRGLDLHVLARSTEGLKPQLVAELGGQYHSGSVLDLDFQPDVVVECTGVDTVVLDVLRTVAPDGVVCLTGVGSGRSRDGVDTTVFARDLVLGNNAVFGSVNANRRHWAQAAEALGRADAGWLSRMITSRYPLEDYARAYDGTGGGDIKVVLEFAAGG
ncbi:Threonine dehydrogenase [Micromonospora pattaloongensis]|uniref:Threonine dehydrogenase n=2 Tax=Micromonospora pattaloongensis TaxID=405436 RepID=A0A1H3MRL0_9ACTN|nr:Threonine dehydrogenase [Micromonospora pattaloongensis]